MKRLFLSVLTIVALFATLTLNAQNGSINKAPSASKDTRDTSDPLSIRSPRLTAFTGPRGRAPSQARRRRVGPHDLAQRRHHDQRGR